MTSSMTLHHGIISSGQTRAVAGANVLWRLGLSLSGLGLSSKSLLVEAFALTTTLVWPLFTSSLHLAVIRCLALLSLWNVGHSLVWHCSLDLAHCVLQLHTKFFVSHHLQPLFLDAHLVFMGLPTYTCVPYKQMSYTHRFPILPSHAFLYYFFFYSHITP